jgi:hypothetical protein
MLDLKRCLIDQIEVNPMKPKKQFMFKNIIFAIVLLFGTFLFISADRFDSSPPFKIPNASADAHLGILGQPAPELNLSTWIDGNGKKTESFRLSSYRGKVVYLYFFQDW